MSEKLSIEDVIARKIDDIKIGPKRLTKYERARIIAARAIQLSMGAAPLIDISKLKSRDPVVIAEQELLIGVLPIIIKREKPNSEYQLIPLKILTEVEQKKIRSMETLVTKIFGEEA
ncbi:MAG: DNA-directed RNA polymerase subunit K [Ignisphaera sp.]|nr:DNA-directed RNA polymerase subunit K [Ignisphaera sp.]MCX8168151.1 DNA-directed RNA polymerase subunit K [Ignisphaera sp.]MDW8085209.1 DNA-directed RNA polymerase subunit K [Ignisphaera sp.]